MWTYAPPLRDMRFVIEDVLGVPAQWAVMPAFAELDADTAAQVLEEAGRFAAQVLAPINAPGDLQGCTWQDGAVRTPDGFRQAYQAFVDAGWPALPCDPAYGGQGLPQLLNAALYEMLAGANHAWTMYPGLLHGAYECLHAHAAPELREAWLPKIVSGQWLSTMCLTEAQAGSDLGLIATRAEPVGDGRYAVRGTKIFISGGEHDLTENIVHLVLARLPDAPPGSRGLSLLLVPKRLPTDDGFVPNALRCDGIEKKMGIKGSATCVMRFDGATGWLIGEPHQGLPAMFVMMNAARLHVGLQGLGHAEAASQNALRYAAERLQGRAALARRDPAQPADPILQHPAVRRSLLRQRALVEGGRILAYQTAHQLDVAEHADAAAQREQARDAAALLTPVVKAFLTDTGFAIASDALQLFGGHGYVHDFGIEQTVRDSRIAMVYEGTNEIQAIDLLVRKVVPDGGARLRALLDALAAQLPEGELAERTRGLFDELRAVTARVAQGAAADAQWPHRAAVDYLRLVGLALLAQAWARSDAAAARHADAAFAAEKRAVARHGFDFVLPEAALHIALIDAARAPLPSLQP